MYAQVEKPKENKSRAVANSVTQKKSNGKQGFGFVDNRPVSIAQRNMQALVNYSTSHPIQKKENKAQHSNVVQRKTTIKHVTGGFTINGDGDGEDDGPYKVGKKMTAHLDPADIVKGSSTGQNWVWMQKLSKLVKAPMIRGHLLNHDLGGHGGPANLYPITSKANAVHAEEVEYPIKDLLKKVSDANTESNLEWDNPGYKSVIYNVDVIQNNNINAKFDCKWRVEQRGGPSLPEKHISVDSTPETLVHKRKHLRRPHPDLENLPAWQHTQDWDNTGGVISDKIKIENQISPSTYKEMEKAEYTTGAGAWSDNWGLVMGYRNKISDFAELETQNIKTFISDKIKAKLAAGITTHIKAQYIESYKDAFITYGYDHINENPDMLSIIDKYKNMTDSELEGFKKISITSKTPKEAKKEVGKGKAGKNNNK